MIMTWNYRVLRTTTENALHEKEHFYTIHEVYYDKINGKVVSWSTHPSPVGSESLAGLHDELDRMRNALNKPVLTRSADGSTLVELPLP